MDLFKLSGIGGIGSPGGRAALTGLSTYGLPGGLAANRSLGAGSPPTDMGPLLALVQQQERLTVQMLTLLLELLKNSEAGGGGGGSPGGGGSVGGGGAVGDGSSGRVGDIINAGGGPATDSAPVGGGTAGTDSGPVVPGTEGALQKANSMVGQDGNSAEVQEITGKSGLDASSQPWCAAFAMNLLEEYGVMDLSGLSNKNYVPTIKEWAQGKGNWAENGSYTPKPGDAVTFDWDGDGTPDHIGIVEKVEGGTVYTIEGNSSNSVRKNSYALGDGQIDGYVKANGKGGGG